MELLRSSRLNTPTSMVCILISRMALREHLYEEITQSGGGFHFVFKLIKQMAEGHFITNQSEGCVGGTEKVSSSEDISININSWSMEMTRVDTQVFKKSKPERWITILTWEREIWIGLLERVQSMSALMPWVKTCQEDHSVEE